MVNFFPVSIVYEVACNGCQDSQLEPTEHVPLYLNISVVCQLCPFSSFVQEVLKRIARAEILLFTPILGPHRSPILLNR